MNFHVLTLFPDMIRDGMNTSIIGRAMAGGFLDIEAVKSGTMHLISIRRLTIILMEAAPEC